MRNTVVCSMCQLLYTIQNFINLVQLLNTIEDCCQLSFKDGDRFLCKFINTTNFNEQLIVLSNRLHSVFVMTRSCFSKSSSSQSDVALPQTQTTSVSTLLKQEHILRGRQMISRTPPPTKIDSQIINLDDEIIDVYNDDKHEGIGDGELTTTPQIINQNNK